MECPNGCGELTNALSKGVPFQDWDENYITLRLRAEWCPECQYVHSVIQEN